MVLNFGLVAVLVGTKYLLRFPLFGAYAVFTFVTSIVLYCMVLQHLVRTHSYFYAYWIFEGISLILGLAVVFEIFGRLLTPYPALRRLALLIFRWSTIALVVMGCLVLYAQSVAAIDWSATLVQVMEEAVRVIEVGLLMFLFLFSTAFGLHWRQSLFGMALGLGILTTIELIIITVRNFRGPVFNEAFSVLRGIAFNISLIVWAGYLLVPESETDLATPSHHGQLEQWNQALTEFIYQ